MPNSSGAKSLATAPAALAICESLLLALSDLKLISEREVRGILDDAAGAFRNGGATGEQAAVNPEVVAIPFACAARGEPRRKAGHL
jgi:hypothetical protein